MIEQRVARKAHDDVHYAGAVYKYAKEYAVSIRHLVSFICTGDKHKISVGVPGFPVAALPRGHRVLVLFYLFIYLFIYFIYSLFKVDKFTIKTDTILYTNKNSYVLILKIKTC